MDKPRVKIKDAVILNRRLIGIPLDHPTESLNGTQVTTSEIVEYVPSTYHPDFSPNPVDFVETKNTLYEVVNWAVE